MTDTKSAKDAADVTDVPEGLDVAVTVPGTYVGSHDLQGTDGTERTDRPGEILGTPVAMDERNEQARQRTLDRHDTMTEAVDRANREDLPKLGGPVEDDWEADESVAASLDARRAAAARPVAPVPVAGRAKAASPQDSGIKVKPGIDRG